VLFTFHLGSTDEFLKGSSTLISPKARDAKDGNEGDTTSGVIKSTVGVPVKRASQYNTYLPGGGRRSSLKEAGHR